MENNQITISLSSETRALSLKVYKDNEARLKKQLKALDASIEKLNEKKEMIEKELAGISILIAQVSGEEPLNSSRETGSETMIEKPENIITEPEKTTEFPVKSNMIFPGKEYTYDSSLGMDSSGYDTSFSWEKKIDYVLKNAPEALKRRKIALYLIGLDSNFFSNVEKLLKTVAPNLSRLLRDNKIITGSDGSQGDYYLHPSWVENGEIKPEFKDRCPENLRII